MSQRAIVLIGGPDAGKTNFVGRLWHALKDRRGALHASGLPDDISYVEETIAHLFEGRFAPRSELGGGRRDFAIAVTTPDLRNRTELVIPDISGELWMAAVRDSEIEKSWMEELGRADGAVLFVRVRSEAHVDPLDWVTSGDLLRLLGEDTRRDEIPTQVVLCELVRFLEYALSAREDGGAPRLAVVISAYDLLDAEARARGPEAYVRSQYPMLAGHLDDTGSLDTRYFGLSVVGGDVAVDEAYRDAFLDRAFEENGYVFTCDSEGVWRELGDVTLPIAWLVDD